MKHRSAAFLTGLFLTATAAGVLFNACKGGSDKGETPPHSAAAPAPAPQAPANPAPASQAPAPVPANPAAAAPQTGTGTARPAPASAPGKMDFSIPLQPITNLIAGFSIYAGKQVLIFYFGPTCPHCQHAFPEIQAFAGEIRPRGVETVAIANMRSNPEEIQEFITKFQAKIPVYWDKDRRFGEAYDVKALPTIYLVGKTGDVFRLDNYSGKPSLDTLRAHL